MEAFPRDSARRAREGSGSASSRSGLDAHLLPVDIPHVVVAPHARGLSEDAANKGVRRTQWVVGFYGSKEASAFPPGAVIPIRRQIRFAVCVFPKCMATSYKQITITCQKFETGFKRESTRLRNLASLQKRVKTGPSRPLTNQLASRGDMWGVVARIAAAAAVLTLVQHNISQMYKAYYDERMKEEAGPTKLFPKIDPEDRDGTARGAPRGGRRERGAGGGRSMSTATIASVGGAWAAAVATGDALASRRAPGGVGGAASGGGDLTMTRDPRCVAAALRACRTLARR